MEEYLDLSPISKAALQKRLDSIHDLKNYIQQTQKMFVKYANVGNELCNCMTNLSKSFKSLSEFDGDPTIDQMASQIDNFVNVFEMHYSLVDSSINDYLSEFIAKDINNAVEKSKVAEKDQDNCLSFLDKYAAVSKKRPQFELEELDARLMAQYGSAVFNNFYLAHAIEIVERKKAVEIASRVCYFCLLFKI